MKMSVGQVIFLLTAKSSKVYPALVCEEIKKRSLSGETVNYVVRLPTEDGREVEISQLDAEVFETVENARKAIIDRISSQVDKMLDEARSMATIFSDDAMTIAEENALPHEVDEPVDKVADFALVDLGDGKLGRVSVKNVKDAIGENQ